jgi:hypothetical protein
MTEINRIPSYLWIYHKMSYLNPGVVVLVLFFLLLTAATACDRPFDRSLWIKIASKRKAKSAPDTVSPGLDHAGDADDA